MKRLAIVLALALAGLAGCQRQPGTRPPAADSPAAAPALGAPATERPVTDSSGPPASGGALPPGLVGCLDGIAVNEENEPVAGVKITLASGSVLAFGALRGLLRPVDVTTISGPDGTFGLCDVPVGRNYVLFGEHPDYIRSDVAGFTVEAERATGGVVLSMSAGARIHGIVSTHGGGPLPDARVELAYAMDLAFQKVDEQAPAQIAFTDREGRYAFRHVSPTSVRISVQADGFASRARSINLALQPTQGDQECHFELEPGATLAGRVVDADGRGIRGARLVATPVAKENEASIHARSDEQGCFLLEGAGPEPYQLTGVAAGYTEQTFGPVDALARDVVIVLARQGSVSGVVTLVTGAPVDNFSLHLRRVNAIPSASFMNSSQRYEAVGGRFTFDGIDPGDYVLEARADGAADTCSEAFTIKAGISEPPSLSIRMRSGGTLEGHVLDAVGRPLAGALVTLNTNNYVDLSIARLFKAITPGDEHERSASTAADGSYSFAHVPEGLWQLVAEHADAASRVLNDVPVQEADAGPTLPVYLVLPPGASIAGQVVDDRDLPVSHAELQICAMDNSSMEGSATDAEGRFRITKLRAGSYKLTVRPERVRGRPIHPFIQLVIALKSMVNVTVAEGQAVNDVLIRMKEQ